MESDTPLPSTPPSGHSGISPSVFVGSLLAVLMLGMGGTYLLMRSSPPASTSILPTPSLALTAPPTSMPQAVQTITPLPSGAEDAKEGLTPLDKVWQRYTNIQLGFTFDLPIEAYQFGGNCAKGELSSAFTPLTVFTDTSGVYLTYRYFYEYPRGGACQKTTNTLNIIKDRLAEKATSPAAAQKFMPSNWHIVVATVNNDLEVDKFIKDRFGTGCRLDSKSLNSQNQFDVKLTGDGLDLSVSKCPVNFIYAIKYSPEKHKAAAWPVGQALIFPSGDNNSADYDAKIINSFAFL